MTILEAQEPAEANQVVVIQVRIDIAALDHIYIAFMTLVTAALIRFSSVSAKL